MSWFVNFFNKGRKAKQIPELTQFLATNPLFKRFALGIHKEKTETLNEIDAYLEEKLLTKEQYDAKYSAKRID